MSAMEEIAQELPAGAGYSWSGISLQERGAGSSTLSPYGISLVAAFLCLAGLYESWSVPLAVLLCRAAGLFGAALAVGLVDFSIEFIFGSG